MEAGNITVWTLFHGDQLRKQSCPSQGEELDLSGLEGPEEVFRREMNGRLSMIVPTVVSEHNHILLFEGLIPWGGASKKVKGIALYRKGVRLDGGTVPITITTRMAESTDGKEWDFRPDGEVATRRHGKDHVEQWSLLQAIAIPKGNVRSLLLTFKDRSLEPWWRVVKSSAKDLVVETANSY